ncbi:UDP-forming cellulose synthase catalytic subunit [Novosphingobium sp. SL115]|uniref:UDP-forming cellulose synthase catalytic subunit n=1 Tax=Novosphingobium sp. SL115 TaxID=2995150 RepID=UPI002275506E|nr:UDP-forming cellulose synthase catalytic subunit [Novosphingobium sp. SL115]MCY1670883.1 UDP-forming cellulose synthase catalytic subunit [Novosphingobium sp. SL115]
MIRLYRAVLPWLSIAAMVFAAVVVVGVPLDLTQQWLMAGGTVIGTMVLSRRGSRKAALTLGILAILTSSRYMFWRTTQTLQFNTLPEFLFGGGLYLAELYAWILLLLGFLQTSWPLERPPVEIEGEPETWPTVDVYIPTYNESLDIVRNTVYAAMDMDYPVDRFRVYILDDGRRPEFRAFAREAGCGYITRDNNLHAKAGNLNAAMKKTDGQLIAIFDCDHVPNRSFLQLTLGWFQKDAKLALMQTPHFFYSPDPVQRNLAPVRDMPGEGDLFYNPVQDGNDLWNATFFCGSCAVIRREALMQTNGFAGETVTEDAHTALKLQRMGWNTAYISARLSAGLATERLVVHVGQRIRWARGMTQIMRIDNPLLGKGLKWQQRLCYLNAMLHFQFPLPRIVFLTSPLAYLIFGQNIIQASASLIFAYALPHLFCSQVASERQQSGWRRPFWGEIYETILAFHLVAPTVITWFQPRKGKFNVTDKGGLLDRTYFDWAIVKPHLITIGLLVGGMLLAIAKYAFFAQYFNVQLDTLALNLAWAAFSLILLIAAVSVARETRQARQEIRLQAQLPVTVHFASGHVAKGTTTDISMGGAAITLPTGVAPLDVPVTHIVLSTGAENLSIRIDQVRRRDGFVSVRFLPLENIAARQLVRAIMGRADAWQRSAPPERVEGLRSLQDIIVIDAMTVKRALRLNFAERRAQKAEMAAQKKADVATNEKTSGTAGALMARAAGIALALAAAGYTLLPYHAFAATVAAPATPPAPAAGSTERLTFKDLRIRNAIRLQGTRGEISIPFGLRQDQVVSAASITLQAAWSPALLGDSSQLVVIVNGEVAQIVALRAENSGGQVITVPVNPALFLPGDNQLNLRLIGHYARDCEDPFSSLLWANISNTRSWLDLTTQYLPARPDLARMPAPFFEKGINSTLKVPFVFAGQPRAGELEAAAPIASWLGSLASYRGFSFKPSFGQIPTGNAVVFLNRNGAMPELGLAVTGPSAAVIPNPRDRTGTLLVIMGRDNAELRLAAGAIATGKGVFGGARMSFEGARIPTWPRYGAPRWLPTDRAIRLGELVEPYALQGMGLPPGPLTARFRAAPDLFFWPRQGGEIDLRYRYPVANWLDRDASRLDVSLNGQYLKTLPLTASWWTGLFGTKGATSHDGHQSVVLPRYALFGQNEIVFDYNLIVANKQKCTGMLPDNVRVSVLPDTLIDLTDAYHGIEMPDLAPFAGAGYPFTVRPDLAETTVVMVGNPSAASVEAFLGLMGRFGDATGAAATGVTVTDRIEPSRLADQDVLVIGSSSLASAEQFFADAPVHYEGGGLKVTQRSPLQYVGALFSNRDQADPQDVAAIVQGSRGFSGIASFRSPYADDRTVVALLADDVRQLPLLVDGMADAKINAQIQGDLSVTSGDGMASFAVGPTYWVGSLPVWMKVAYWFSKRPLLMALSTLLLALALTGPAYLFFSRQAKARLATNDEKGT